MVVESLLLNSLYYFQRFSMSQKPRNLFSFDTSDIIINLSVARPPYIVRYIIN